MKIRIKILLLIALIVGLSACGGARLATGKGSGHNGCASSF